MKYVGIWWEMHLGKSTWDMEGSQNMNTFTEGEKGPAVMVLRLKMQKIY